MFQGRMKLVCKSITRATCTGAGWVTALGHEVGDYPMKNSAIVKSFTRQKNEVIDRPRGFICKKLHYDLTFVGAKGRSIFLFWVYYHFGRILPLLAHIFSFQGWNDGLIVTSTTKIRFGRRPCPAPRH